MKPHRKSRSSPVPRAGPSRAVRGGLLVAAAVCLPLLAVGSGDDVRAALDSTTGVLSLVALTASIAWGLLATDRLLLSPRHRLVAQAVHRATAVGALGFLLLHAAVKVSLGHVPLLGALVPFGLGVTSTEGLIGFGALAGVLMVVTGATGALRSALAGNVRVAGRWRSLHVLAYPGWCFALVHGLFAGRPAPTWVVAAYGAALIGVAGALSLRLLPRPAQRRLAARIAALTDGGRDTGTKEAPPAPMAGVDRSRTPPTAPQDVRQTAPWRPERATVGRHQQQPRLAPPFPQLYEAPPPPAAEPVEHSRDLGAGSLSGTGMSAAYRAVSRARGSGGTAPLAERVPMTDELPGVPEQPYGPEAWRTPSPPPAPPVPPSYVPGPAPVPPTAPPQQPLPYGHGTPAPYADQAPGVPTTPPSPYDIDTAGAPPGPHPPRAGEPWGAPAGDRP
ncbi:hypothetical protein [Streptomyces sp. NPDC048057]|uniref:hypothetical protein n=1 Tax=Streptomyces sp. NPDC048057 TaxID=3155628 RepID=UPI0033E85420